MCFCPMFLKEQMDLVAGPDPVTSFTSTWTADPAASPTGPGMKRMKVRLGPHVLRVRVPGRLQV